MKKKIRKIVYIGTVACLGLFNACSTSDLDPSLEQSNSEEDAVISVSDMQVLLNGALNRMTNSGYYGRDFIITNEVRTPNTFSNGNSGRFLTEAGFLYLPSSIYMWDNGYSVIANANILINTDVELLDGDTDLGLHIQGEAYALRALTHFDLLKTYGQQHVGGSLGIPYIKEFKGGNDAPARETIESNIQDIMSDLEMAYSLMSEDYYDSSKEFLSKYVAKALESRVAVYFGMWEEARDAAKLVIDSGDYSIIGEGEFVDSYGQDGSANSLFELAFSETDNLGSNSLSFIYRGGTYGDVQVLPNVEDLYDEGDVRMDILGYEGDLLRNVYKYPEQFSNVPIIRYEEVVLNYGEALLNLGQSGDALTWLNMIPASRTKTPDNPEEDPADLTYTAATTENFLKERRKEFIFEGLYFWDLLRNEMNIEKVDPLQNIEETIPYGDFRLAYPIPLSELDANSSMEQNPGYGS